MANFIPADYIDVQVRIVRFWGEHPGGRIETNLMSPMDDFGQCRYVARVYRADEPQPAATGWAFEIAGGQGANKTSHEENCETSAIGRALANLGYATRGADRPSRQEMEKAARGANAAAAPSPTPIRNEQRASGPASQPQRESAPTPGPGVASEKQIKYLFGLATEANPDKDITNEDFLHGQVYARFTVAHLSELTKTQASTMVDYLKNRDFIDAVMPPTERVDPQDSGEIETRESLGLNIRALRERLGWDEDGVRREAAEQGINLRTMDGLRQMVGRLTVLLDAAEEYGPDSPSLPLDAEFAVAGEPGFDRHTAT